MDPVMTMTMYLMLRGEAYGLLFCPFKMLHCGVWEMSAHIRLKDNAFLESMRRVLDEAGVDSYRFLGTHSCKRGGAQLYCLQGVADAEIKARSGWHTTSANWANVQASSRLEWQCTYTSPAAALTDVIINGGEVPKCVRESIDW